MRHKGLVAHVQASTIMPTSNVGVASVEPDALQDVAEAVMLAVRTKQSCTPSDITLRPTEPVQPLD